MNNKAKNYVILGESGSGKTEFSVNLALNLAKTKNNICFFDMDQTKGIFRARDLKEILIESGVDFLDTMDFMDSPIVPTGATGRLEDESTVCVFDVGGNAIGAKMVGQFSRHLHGQKTEVLYIINPFRPFSDSADALVDTMDYILKAARFDSSSIKIVSNPCMGTDGNTEELLAKHELLCKNLSVLGKEISMISVERKFTKEIEAKTNLEVFPLDLFVCKLYMP